MFKGYNDKTRKCDGKHMEIAGRGGPLSMHIDDDHDDDDDDDADADDDDDDDDDDPHFQDL